MAPAGTPLTQRERERIWAMAMAGERNLHRIAVATGLHYATVREAIFEACRLALEHSRFLQRHTETDELRDREVS